MVEVTRTFDVERPHEDVRDYLRDFAHAQQWDPSTVSCTRIDSGPLAVGARWHHVSRVMGTETELTYKLTRSEAGRLTFVGTNDTATSTDDITIAAAQVPGSTTITYHASIDFHGIAKLAAPVAKVFFEKLGDDTQDSLTEILNGHH